MPPRTVLRGIRPQAPTPRPSTAHAHAHPTARPPQRRQSYASVATSTTPAAPLDYTTSGAPIRLFPRTQPPSYKPPELRKSQLFRQYASLLEATPLMLLFQHNNLKAIEWAAIRRELAIALRKSAAVDAPADAPASLQDPADAVRLTTIQTGIFAAALRVVEFHDPSSSTSQPTHRLSTAAYTSTRPRSAQSTSSRTSYKKHSTSLHTLLSGPLAVLTFPSVTPAQLAAALTILAPTPGAASAFPAPRRKAAPGYYENATQLGLQKLLLLGARVEGRVLDGEGVRWVGGVRGGVDGLRAQLVAVLQGVGVGVAGALEGVGRGLYVAVEGRRLDMEEKEKPVVVEEEEKV